MSVSRNERHGPLGVAAAMAVAAVLVAVVLAA